MLDPTDTVPPVSALSSHSGSTALEETIVVPADSVISAAKKSILETFKDASGTAFIRVTGVDDKRGMDTVRAKYKSSLMQHPFMGPGPTRSSQLYNFRTGGSFERNRLNSD